MMVLDLRYVCVADVLQCVAVFCSQLSPRHDGFESEVRVCCRCVADVLQMCCSVMQCDAVCYSVLHCGAVCRSVVQGVAV